MCTKENKSTLPAVFLNAIHKLYSAYFKKDNETLQPIINSEQICILNIFILKLIISEIIIFTKFYDLIVFVCT